MKAKKAVVWVALVTMFCSDFLLGIAPALGQAPGPTPGQQTPTLDGNVPLPSLGEQGRSDSRGRAAPPQQTPSVNPPAGGSPQPGPNTSRCQVAAAPRTVAVPVEPSAGATVVQQAQAVVPGGVGQMGQLPSVDIQRRALASGATPEVIRTPETEEISRIETAFQQIPLPGSFGTPIRQYGYSMFTANVSTFAPIDDIPVGPDYVLGPGDDLTINVWGGVDSTLIRTVDRNGRIVLPKVGDLRIWGLTFAQADRLIRDQLARYFRGFQTSVTMGRLRIIRVHVVGEVCQPGAYTLSSLSTLTNALFSAGGPTKLGSLREVRLIRGSHQVAKLDLYDFLQRGDRTRDYRLESGDTIFVPMIGDVVAVAGEVKRPAIYEIRSTTRL